MSQSHVHYTVESDDKDNHTPLTLGDTITQKELLPMVIGIGMLIVSGLIGYYIGVTSQTVAADATQEPARAEQQAGVTVVSPAVNPNVKQVGEIPSSWGGYDKPFGPVFFSFQIPETHEVQDFDLRAQIYVTRKGQNAIPSDVVIDSFRHTFYFQEYSSGTLEDWFRTNVSVMYPDADLSALQYEDIDLEGGKIYLKVSNWPQPIQEINPNLFSGTWYVSTQNGISYYVVDNGGIAEQDMYKVLSTISVREVGQ